MSVANQCSATKSGVALYLSSDGNSLKIKNSSDDPITPQQEKAQARVAECKTHEQVLSILLQINEGSIKDHLSYFHFNAPYGGHHGTSSKGQAHPCLLANQIEFVNYKIREKAYASVNSIKELLTYCLRAFIDDLQDKLNQAELTTTFWGGRKVCIPNETDVSVYKIARLVNKLYNQCTLGERNVHRGNQNYAQGLVDTVHAFYHRTDTLIANSNIFKKALVWVLEFRERNFIYSTRWWISFNTRDQTSN